LNFREQIFPQESVPGKPKVGTGAGIWIILRIFNNCRADRVLLYVAGNRPEIRILLYDA
jgi:hypothetical protein